MKILYIVTARGGSQGVPKKNIRKLGGLPLIAYKIIAVKNCIYDGRIIVSTDDCEISNISKQYGAEVPFIRPKELATNEASTVSVVKHALEWVEKNDSERYNYICLLEPSSPFASNEDFNKAIDNLIKTEADVLLGVKETEVSSKFLKPLDSDGKLSYFYEQIKDMKSIRRQDQEKEYTLNGCMYIVKTEYFKQSNLFHAVNSIPYLMDARHSLEIDSMDDYEYAEYLVNTGKIDISKWTRFL